MKHHFHIYYEILKIGELEKKNYRELELIDIINYSIEGNITIRFGVKTLNLIDFPLIEAFHAIAVMLKTVPVYRGVFTYAQMFREARTIFSIKCDDIVIDHKEVRVLMDRCGDSYIEGSYVNFSIEFGNALRKFISDLKEIAPNLFYDEKIMEKLSDIFIVERIKKYNDTNHIY